MYHRTVIILAIVLASCTLRLYGQDTEAKDGESNAQAATAISVGLGLATTAEAFLYDRPYFPGLLLGTATAQNIPGLIFGSEDAWTRSGMQLGLDGLYAFNELAFGANAMSPLFFNTAHKYSMYNTYATYADLRSKATDPDYAAISQYDFPELLSATFKPSSYDHWIVSGFVASFALYGGISIAAAGKENAVWNTGKAYIGTNEFPVWAGIPLMLLLQIPNFVMTGIGEESYFRGTVYEELGMHIGHWPAKTVDALYFTLCHFPQKWDKIMTTDPLDLLITTSLSMFTAFWFQYIYDTKGLPSAIAAHASIDILIFFMDWLVQGGIPNHAGFSINNRVGSISFNFDY